MARMTLVLDPLDPCRVGDLATRDGVADVEGVDDLVATVDTRAATTSRSRAKRAAVIRCRSPTSSSARTSTTVEPAEALIVDADVDLHRARRHRPPAPGVGARLLGQPLLERQGPPQDGLELIGHELEVGPAAPGGLDHERLHGEAVLAGDVGGADVEAPQREHAGDRREQSGTVARHHGHVGRVGGDDGATEALDLAHEAAVAVGDQPAWPRRTSPPERCVVTLCTRSATSPAFHWPHAAGPVARLSASVRAARSSSWARSLHRGGHRLHRGGVVEVAAGGDFGEQQVVADQSRQDRHVLGREAHATGHGIDHDLMPASVWSPGKPLPMSCSSGADEQQVGAV